MTTTTGTRSQPASPRWHGLSLWMAAGAVVILLVVLGVMARQNIVHQQRSRLLLLEEKGAALIRSFEAGTRTGMMGKRWGRVQLQTLLQETARQPDIRYLLVADKNGTVRFHSDTGRIGSRHAAALDLEAVIAGPDPGLHTRRIAPEGQPPSTGPVFEVFKRFHPLKGPTGRGHSRHRMGRQWRSTMHSGPDRQPSDAEDLRFRYAIERDWVIFVGLDLAPVQAANRAAARQTLIIALVMLMVGVAGIMLLLVGQQYHATHSSLVRIKAFSDTLVAHLPIGVVAVDDHGTITGCNPALGRIVGRPPEALMGRPAAQALPDGLWQAALEAGRSGTVSTETDCRMDDGRTVGLEIGLTPLGEPREGRQGCVALFRDLSEVQDLRRKVARSQRLAAVGRLAAGVAHEIRNPLSSIKGLATYFKQRYAQVPEDQSIADLMIQEVDRLNRVITQMIEFSRPLQLTRQQIELQPLLETTVKLIRPQVEEAGLVLDPHWPADPMTLPADPDRMRQVLLNLLLNAVEASPPGGRITVRAAAVDSPAGVELQVADTGDGIAEADLAQVFDPYFTTKPNGTGLGLAIVHNIVEAHGGRIRIDSDRQQGTTVTVFWPGDLLPDPPSPQAQSAHLS